VLVLVGTTGSGAGLPGGGGVLLDLSHPRYVDARIRALSEAEDHRRPQSVAVADDMIAVMLHKPQCLARAARVVAQVHSRLLKHEISRRLKHKVMFGADYPLFTYERLVKDWEAQGFDEATLQRVFTANAKQLFPSLAQG
jgi:predicted TIM-barrel fold metal-dependent hydrolase